MIWTLNFWRGLGERAIKTFAQALVAVIGADSVGILSVDWQAALSVAALAALVSALTSIGNADFVAGTPPEALAPDVIAQMSDDEDAKARFQLAVLPATDDAALVASARRPLHDPTDDEPSD